MAKSVEAFEFSFQETWKDLSKNAQIGERSCHKEFQNNRGSRSGPEWVQKRVQIGVHVLYRRSVQNVDP